jgi:hypothetical protein
MPANRNSGRADEESLYLALLNALSEIEYDMPRRDVPKDARDLLGQVIGLCRLDYHSRFG